MRQLLNAGAGVATQAGVVGVAVGFLFLAIFSFTTDSLFFLAGWIVDMVCWIFGGYLLVQGYLLVRRQHKAELAAKDREIAQLKQGAQQAQFGRIDGMAERAGLVSGPPTTPRSGRIISG